LHFSSFVDLVENKKWHVLSGATMVRDEAGGARQMRKDGEELEITTKGRRGNKARRVGRGPRKTMQQTTAPDVVSWAGA
jgi:hypothetical protein